LSFFISSSEASPSFHPFLLSSSHSFLVFGPLLLFWWILQDEVSEFVPPVNTGTCSTIQINSLLVRDEDLCLRVVTLSTLDILLDEVLKKTTGPASFAVS
jgi:hypothetical protein